MTSDVKVWYSAEMKKGFGIRELAEQARAAGAHDLAQGVIDAEPPEVLLTALRELPLEEYSSYNNKRGVPVYREAVREYLAGRGWPVVTAQVLATSGITGATTAALLADLKPGAKVLLPEPFFIGHKLLLEALGMEIVYWPMPLTGSDHWHELGEKMEEVEAVIVTNPHNPTGQVVPLEVVKALAERAVETKTLLLLDEMYRDFVWEAEDPFDDAAYAGLNLQKTVVMRGWSKSLAIPGWRVGFAITSPERVEAMAGRHDALYLGGSTLGQHGLAVALDQQAAGLQEYIGGLRERLLANRELLAEAFAGAGFTPVIAPATYYMLLEHHKESDLAVMEELIERLIVATPLSILTSKPDKPTGFIRIHFGVSEITAQEVADILLT